MEVWHVTATTTTARTSLKPVLLHAHILTTPQCLLLVPTHMGYWIRLCPCIHAQTHLHLKHAHTPTEYWVHLCPDTRVTAYSSISVEATPDCQVFFVYGIISVGKGKGIFGIWMYHSKCYDYRKCLFFQLNCYYGEVFRDFISYGYRL